MLPGQMLLQQLKYVQDSPKSLPLKLGQKIKVQKKVWSSKILITKKIYPKSFVKIRSVTAEIFLIWINGHIFPGHM